MWTPSTVHFVLVGDPNFPNGGMLARFPGLTLPSLGITFYGATPDDLYPTTIYNQEYDGFADIPQYPIDFISDLNAFLGFHYVHPTYRDLAPDTIREQRSPWRPTGHHNPYFMIPDLEPSAARFRCARSRSSETRWPICCSRTCGCWWTWGTAPPTRAGVQGRRTWKPPSACSPRFPSAISPRH